MTDQTTQLQLPIMAQGQAQKHINYNAALGKLDALVQLSVLSQTVGAPPSDAPLGARYIIPEDGGGIWPGSKGEIALAVVDGWSIFIPQAGWLAWVQDTQKLVVFDGAGWILAQGAADLQNLPSLGVATTANDENRLAVASDTALFTHAGSGHQLKINKADSTETASMLLQSNWQGRAEIGLVGDDDLAIKVSADGAHFTTAMQINHLTGRPHLPQGATGLTPDEFGLGPMVNTDYVASQAMGVTNGALSLSGAYNWPDQLTRNTWQSPNLPASGEHTGYFTGVQEWAEFIPVDPHSAYRLRAYMRQNNGPNGNADRHQHGIGLACYDADFNRINAQHHSRFFSGTFDSMTTLAAPLAPGDTKLHLDWAGAWNDTDPNPALCGVMVLFYKTTGGQFFDRYTRHVALDLFDPAGVDKSTGTVTLKNPWPAELANPDHGDGIWPAGTLVAGTGGGMDEKFCALSLDILPESDQWYQATGYIGGVDESGTNNAGQFPPGTCYVRPCFAPAFSNRPGGWQGFPDTGTDHSCWIAGLSFLSDPTVTTITHPDGKLSLHRQAPAEDLQTIALVPAQPSLIPV